MSNRDASFFCLPSEAGKPVHFQGSGISRLRGKPYPIRFALDKSLQIASAFH